MEKVIEEIEVIEIKGIIGVIGVEGVKTKRAEVKDRREIYKDGKLEEKSK